MRIRLIGRSLTVVIALWVVVASTAEAATRIVPTDFPTIQGAVNASRSGDVVIVAPGTYSENVVIADKRLFLRSINSHNESTVAATIIDLTGRTGPGLEVKGSGAQGTTVSGFTVRNSAAEGIVVSGTAATIEYCQIRQNQLAGIRSAGGCVADNIVSGNGTDGILVSNCQVKDNSVSENGGCGIKSSLDGIISGNTIIGNGGSGILMQGSGSHRIAGNAVSGSGDGGIICENSGEISGNLVSANTAASSAGVRITGDGPFSVTRNLICSNTATVSGGGMSIGYSDAELINNTIAANTAPVGAGLQLAGYNGNLPKISNCVIAFNRVGGGLVGPTDATPTLSYNDVFGNEGGNYVGIPDSTGVSGNLSVDPLFASVGGGDFRLKSRGGRFNGSAWIIDAVSSPCIDAGDPASAFSLEPTPNGGRINMGYDGNTSRTSKSGIVIVPCVINCGPRGSGRSVATSLTVRFNTPMKQGSVQNNFYINGKKVTTGTFTWLGTKMTYKPAVNFQAGRRYQVKIAKAALSRAGVKMEAQKIWNFVTAAAPTQVTVTALPSAAGAHLAVSLSAPAEVTVTIRNLAGREIAILSPGLLEAGVHSLVWNGKSRTGTAVPSGTYLVKLTGLTADGTSCSGVGVLRR
ncbi:MAG: right-handed parallel beta-helix repeat-containing protein [Armatimonadota bacterium]